MKHRTARTLPLLGLMALIAALAIPATASAAVLHFQGKATGAGANPDFGITFDVTSKKGRPGTISNIYVTDTEFFCHFGTPSTIRNVRMFDTGTFARNGEFEVRETALPPGADNWLLGKFQYPKKGKRKKPTIKGSFSGEFGFGESRDEYNCLTFEDFVATPVK